MNYKENKNTFDITNSLAKNSQFLKIQNTLQRKQNAVKQTINFYKLFGRLLIWLRYFIMINTDKKEWKMTLPQDSGRFVKL